MRITARDFFLYAAIVTAGVAMIMLLVVGGATVFVVPVERFERL